MSTSIKFEGLDSMTQAEEMTFWSALESVWANDDGAAGADHLAAGRAIYYCDDRYPDTMVRKWPDGRRELVLIDDEGILTTLGPL